MTEQLMQQVENEAKALERRRCLLDKIGKGIRGDLLMTTVFPPRRMVIDGILVRGELCALSGPKGSGKTLLSLNMAQASSAGLPFLGLQSHPTKTLYISLEMGPRTIQTRLGESRIPWDSSNVEFHFTWPRLPDGLEVLEAVISERGIGLVFIDVIAKIRPRGSDWSSYGDAYDQFAPLREIAQRTDSCIVLLTHERKGETAEDPAERILGSIGLSGNAGVLISLRRRIHEPTGAVEVSGNDISHLKIPVELKTDPLQFVRSDVTFAEIIQTPERRAILAAIRELGGNASPSHVAVHLGKERSNITHQIREMAKAGELVSIARGLYSIPEPFHFHHSPSLIDEENRDIVNDSVLSEPPPRSLADSLGTPEGGRS